MTLVKKALSVVTRRKGRPTPHKATPFDGFRKHTMTVREFVSSTASLLPETPTLYRVWVKHEIDPGFREELMLAVSKLNDCRYCSWVHHEWANIAHVPEEELAFIEQLDPSHFDRKKWVAIAFVRELVEARFGRVSKELMREMKANYSATEIREIKLIAKVMDISNRGVNTWDSMLSRLRGKPAADSHLLDEAVLSMALLAAAPVVIVLLARASKRPILETARAMIDYTRHMEERDAEKATNP